MKRVSVVLGISFCAIFLSGNISMPYVIAQGDSPKQEKSETQATLYLKTGEIIKGALVEKTADAIVIEKSGITLSFKVGDILKVEEAKTGKDLSAQYTLPFSTAIITYDLKGFDKGKETVYIDALNNKIAKETFTETSYGGQSYKMSTLEIYDGKVIYNIDLGQRRCTAMQQEGSIIQGAFGEQLYFGRPVKLDSFLGKDCNVYQSENMKVYFWYGILLKQEILESSAGPSFVFSKEATDIKLDVSLPPEKFRVPEGIEIKSMEELYKDLDKEAKKIKEEQKKYEQEIAEQYKKELLIKAEVDPEAKKALKEITKADGSLDLEKYYQLMQKQEEKELLDLAKSMEGGEKRIQEATLSDGTIDMNKLRSFVWGKQEEIYRKEAEEREKDILLQRAETDPEIKKIIEECTGRDGIVDIKKARILIEEKEKKQLLEKVKKLKDGEALIQKATTTLGGVDINKLHTLLWEKESELETKARAISEAGRVYEQQKKYTEALEKFTEAIEANPLSYYAYYDRYRVYEFLGENEKALQDLSTLILNDHFANSYYFSQRGDIYARLGKYKEATDDYTRAIEIDGENVRRGIESQKKALRKIGEDNEEIDWAKMSVYNYNLDAILRRGNTYRKSGDYEKAIADFTKVIDTQPESKTSADAYFLRGLTYRQMNEKEKMKADWEKAQSLGDKLVEGEYVQGLKQGQFIWYYVDGSAQSKATYVDDEFEGEFVKYHHDGQISDKGIYKADKLEGPYTWYAPNGQKSEEGYYKNGKKNGIFTNYDSSTGVITKKMNYVDGQLEGECVVLYWHNGIPVEKSMFKNGTRHGMSYKYYENGQIQQEIPFENGLENGTGILYNIDGSFKKKVFFKNGQRVGESYKP